MGKQDAIEWWDAIELNDAIDLHLKYNELT
jgi:hypothetical protein